MASLYHADYLQGGRRRRHSLGAAMVQRGGLRNPFSPYRHSIKRSRKATVGGRRRKTRKTTVGGRRRKTRKGGAMSAGAVRKQIHALLRKL